MKLIDVALATYNGSTFIREQIASIRNQTYKNWRLLISDDNSTDSTVAIVKELMLEDERIRLVNSSRQGGVVKNFNTALQESTADYIVLCDQDDIWPVDRLSMLMRQIELLENNNAEKRILIFTDLMLVNEKDELIAASFYESNKIDPLDNLKANNLLWCSSVYGCTTIMNRKLLDVALPIPDYALMHDHWLALIAHKNGGLHYFDYVSIRYRQHASNVVGGSKKSLIGKVKTLRKNIKTINIQTDKTLRMLKDNNFYCLQENKMERKNDYIKFALKEILPNVFHGNKKMFSLFTFIAFVTR
jgi:glycosyltransferase involved in cell wall biosynthesis